MYKLGKKTWSETKGYIINDQNIKKVMFTFQLQKINF